MSQHATLPTAAEIRRVAEGVRDLAMQATLDDDPMTLRAMLSEAAQRAARPASPPTDALALYRALALGYLRIAGNGWHALAGNAAYETARRAVELADELGG